MGFVGNYAPCGLSPQTDGMPVIQQKAGTIPALVFAFQLHLVPQISLKLASDYAAGCAYCRK